MSNQQTNYQMSGNYAEVTQLPENATQNQIDNWVDEMRVYYNSFTDEAYCSWPRETYMKTHAAAAVAAASTFTDERSEFGMYVFADPILQEQYKHREDTFKKMSLLKKTYDKQELLRKMCVDMKREYLTRKGQVKKLQKSAAVDFRNAEMSLQEHYVTATAEGENTNLFHHVHSIDINAPLVSQIQLPDGENVDLARFNITREFQAVREYHQSLQNQREEAIARFQEAEAECLCRLCKDRAMEENDGYSDDVDYLNDERELHECKAWEVPTLDEDASWMENTRDIEPWSDDDEDQEAELQRQHEEELMEEFIAQIEQIEQNDDMSYQCDDYPDVQQLEVVKIQEPKERITIASAGGGISAKTKAKSKTNAAAAAKARLAKQKHNKERQFIPIRVTVNDNRGSTNADADAEVTLHQSKIEIDLPKQHQRRIEDSMRRAGATSQIAAREAKKREAAKWKRTNADEKQMSARGTRIAELPQTRSWTDCCN